jgi:DNA-directed RNA polymerase specialized sigma24 family protein
LGKFNIKTFDYSTAYSYLVKYVRKRLQTQEDAEDVAQNTLLVFYIHARTHDIEPIYPFLRYIAKQRIGDHNRNCFYERFVDRYNDDIKGMITKPSQYIELKRIYDKVETLTDIEKRTFKYLVNGLIQQEMAGLEGITRQGAQLRIKKLRVKLKNAELFK